MEQIKRKSIRLQNYDYTSCGIYFITICIYKKECLLGNILQNIVGVDAHIDPNFNITMNLSPYGKIVEKYIKGIKGLEKYCIMPNHLHLIIVNERVDVGIDPYIQSIPQKIKSFKTLVTKEIGFSIWQRSYYDHIIRNQKSYEKIWQYIDTNPLKWSEDIYYQ